MNELWRGLHTDGIARDVILASDAGFDLWNHAHTATLEDYRLKYETDLYHPDALKNDN